MPAKWNSARKLGEEINLPSGNTARLRRTLNMYHALEAGLIPNPLADHFRHMIGAASGMEDRPEDGGGTGHLDLKDLSEEALTQWDKFMTESLLDIFVSPKLVIVPVDANKATWEPEGDDEISIADLAYQDRIFAFNYAQGGTQDAARFLEAQPSVGDVANVSGLSDQAVRATGIGRD
jgi:hypothetical protein